MIESILYWIGLGILIVGYAVWCFAIFFGEAWPLGYTSSSVEHMPTDRDGNH